MFKNAHFEFPIWDTASFIHFKSCFLDFFIILDLFAAWSYLNIELLFNEPN